MTQTERSATGSDIVIDEHIIAYDSDWQFPAITEQHAWEMLKHRFPKTSNVFYLAFPWATLIDNLNRGEPYGQHLLAELKSLPVPQDGRPIFTVCQHILLEKFRHLFESVGVTDIFWPHATVEKTSLLEQAPFEIHPFPLYPVQFPHLQVETYDKPRNTLFSFVGARANEWYLTQSRNWILDTLCDDERGFVRGRDKWHYNRTVYDFQTHRLLTTDPLQEEEDKAKEFRDLLSDSTFSLCPSGTGPNSIRIWESIAAGTIPVIIADGLKLPGHADIWDNACVFCKEEPESISQLPDRLSEIAADKDTLRNKREALKQIWYLYGTSNFVNDILAEALKQISSALNSNETMVELNSALQTAAGRVISESDTPKHLDARYLILRSAGLLSSDPNCFNQLIRTSDTLAPACLQATELAPDAAGASKLRDHITHLNDSGKPGTKSRKTRLHLFGTHSNRTPFSYDAFRPGFEKHVQYEDTIEDADLCVTGFELDYKGNTSIIRAALEENPGLNLKVTSEEPLWDTAWTDDPLARTSSLGMSDSELPSIPYAICNHQNHDVFDFERLPYFITTDDKFFLRYATAFSRNAALSEDELLKVWTTTMVRAAFYAEKREKEKYNIRMPEHDIFGLALHRLSVSEKVRRGPVLRIGKGFSTDTARQVIPDWHLDKLAASDRNCLILSALENTHQINYVTEKIFDAFAVLAVPIYYASPNHRIHSLVPEESWINIFGMTASQAATQIDSFEPSRTFARAYLETQKRLSHLFSDPVTLFKERQRVVDAMVDWIHTPS